MFCASMMPSRYYQREQSSRRIIEVHRIEFAIDETLLRLKSVSPYLGGSLLNCCGHAVTIQLLTSLS